MAPSYFAPEFSVTIDSQELAADISKFILDLSVNLEPDAMDHFSLTLANPFPDLPWTHKEGAKLFKEGGSVNISMGYVDDLHPLFSGTLTSASPSFPEGGGATLRVSGFSHLQRLKASTKPFTYRDVTDKDIAQQIATRARLGLEADDTTPTHPYVIQRDKSDYDFLLERASRIGFRVRVQDDKLLFKRDDDPSGPSYTLVWGNAGEPLDEEARVMPLRSFNPTLNVNSQVTKVIVSGLHPTTREPITGEAGIGDEARQDGARSGPQVAKEALGERVERVSNAPVSSQKEAEELARALYNDRANRFITGTGATIGLPDLRAGTLIMLKGLGDRFSGQYYVTQTTHTLSSAGYHTSFTVRKNAIG